MKKIAIFGGSFNPIHKGHINLCLECDAQYNFDKIILMPTNIPPHKSSADLASNEHRFNMCKLAVKDEGKFHVSDIELNKQDVSYTVDTLSILKNEYKEDKLYFIIGSDMLFMFHKWYMHDEILDMVTLIVGARKDDEKHKMLEYKKEYLNNSVNVEIIDIDVFETSSTEIRDALKEKIDTNSLLKTSVLNYIKENNIYV